MTSKWGCLGAVVVGGVGLVLFALGFDSATTEAMPFGAVLTTVGLFVGVPSLEALRAAVWPGARRLGMLLKFSLVVLCAGLVLVGIGVQPATTEAAPFGIGAVVLGLLLVFASLRSGKPAEPKPLSAEDTFTTDSSEPPASVRCASCGSPAPLRLSEPTHATCSHCDSRFALPPALVTVLKAAAILVKAQAEAERRISAILESIPHKHLAWRRQLRVSTVVLVALAVLAAALGYSRRNVDDWWHKYVAFGLASGLLVLVLGSTLSRLLPKVARGIVGHWAALQLPGVQGLACRVCGAPLPSTAAPVLRCEYCAADNLAGAAVQALVAQRAGHAMRSVLSVGQKDRRADELAAFSLAAFPVVTLVGWFGVGAFAGGAGGAWLSDLRISPAPLDFAVVRVLRAGAPAVCVAAVIPRGAQLELEFSGDVSVRLTPEELNQYALERQVQAPWFVGQHVNGLGKIESVYSELRSPNRVEGSLGTLPVYFPYDGRGGEFICLDELEVKGLGLKLP